MDTIVALATPVGRSGIAVIRISGVRALEITSKLVGGKDDFAPRPRYSVLKEIRDYPNGEFIDESIITYFKSPHSFTGEDVVEISCHGAPVLIRQIIDACLRLNARMAEPGEFSLRALSHGKMNLSQAEAVRDLIESRTIASAHQAARQLRGELSAKLQPLKDELLNVIVILESALEFVEDDLPDFQIESINTSLLKISAKIGEMASTFQSGRLLREGLKVALVGRPNVGKSSLFNCLIGVERAIVTDIAGTTRDALYENLSIEGVPISLVDTAGLRETDDFIESIGVERTKGTLNDADLVIVVLDSSENLNADDQRILSEVKPLNHIIAINKIDLNGTRNKFNEYLQPAKCVNTSAKTGHGIDILKSNILAPYKQQSPVDGNFLISDARHYDLLLRAGSEIDRTLELLNASVSEEIILVGLHNALIYLGQITGETSTEDMLSRIFSTFCIGK